MYRAASTGNYETVSYLLLFKHELLKHSPNLKDEIINFKRAVTGSERMSHGFQPMSELRPSIGEVAEVAAAQGRGRIFKLLFDYLRNDVFQSFLDITLRESAKGFKFRKYTWLQKYYSKIIRQWR